MPLVQSISLSETERKTLQGMLRKGRWSPRQLKRAQVLILADTQKDLSNTHIAQRLFCSREMVRMVRSKYISYGIQSALSEKTRTGQPKKLTAQDRQTLLSFLKEPVPAGYAAWTLPLLQKRLFRATSQRVSTETIRRFLSGQKNPTS